MINYKYSNIDKMETNTVVEINPKTDFCIYDFISGESAMEAWEKVLMSGEDRFRIVNGSTKRLIRDNLARRDILSLIQHCASVEEIKSCP